MGISSGWLCAQVDGYVLNMFGSIVRLLMGYDRLLSFNTSVNKCITIKELIGTVL